MRIWIAGFAALLLSGGCSKEQTQATTAQAPAASQVQTDTAALRNVSTPAAKNLLETNPGIIVLDVRTPQEFNAGHLNQAINIDVQAPGFEEKIKLLDRAGTYLVYCAAGRRSAKASALLQEQGFKNVYNCRQGYEDLKNGGIPGQ